MIISVSESGDLEKLLSQMNHPSEEGHTLAVNEFSKYFLIK